MGDLLLIFKAEGCKLLINIWLVFCQKKIKKNMVGMSGKGF